MVTIRNYITGEAPLLAEVLREAARTIGLEAYTPEQTRAWAKYPEDLQAFESALAEGVTLCAVVDDQPVAFGQLHPVDHVALMYCRSTHARRGYARAILAELEAHARRHRVSDLRVEASCVARPFFEKAGYKVVGEERPVRHGVTLLRFNMLKNLDTPM